MKNKERIENLERSRGLHSERIGELTRRLDVLEADKAVDQLLADSDRDELTELREMKHRLEKYLYCVDGYASDTPVQVLELSVVRRGLREILEP